MKKYISILLTLALGLAFSCLPAAAGAKLQITDLAGRKVNVPANPDRIVCLGPGSLRLVSYLGAVDKVVGVERMERRMGGRPYYLAHKKTMDKLPIVSPGGPSAINKKPDMEAILGVKPQVLFITYMKAGLADEVQARLGIPVVVLSYGNLGGFSKEIFRSIRIVGKVMGREKRAGEVIAYLDKAREDLAARAKGRKPSAPTVYVGGLGFRGSHGIESTNTGYIPFMWLKAPAAVTEKTRSGYLFLDKEELLRLQPGMIFIDGTGLELVKADYIKKPDYYRALKAFGQKKVHVLFPYNWYTTNLGTALADAYFVGKMLYPDGFKDIEPVAKTNEIYRFLLGADLYAPMAKLYGPLGAEPDFLNYK